MTNSAEQDRTRFSHAQNMSVLVRQINDVHDEKDRQITTTLTRMSLQEQAMLKSNKYDNMLPSSCTFIAIRRSLANKLHQFQQILDERKLAFDALTTRNTLLEADLTVAKQQHDDLRNDMKKVEIEHEQAIHRIHRECKQEKDVGNTFER
jgi:hypothetical protein